MFPARASENAARPADSADGIMRTRERNPPLSRLMTFPQLSTGRPLPQRFQRFGGVYPGGRIPISSGCATRQRQLLQGVFDRALACGQFSVSNTLGSTRAVLLGRNRGHASSSHERRSPRGASARPGRVSQESGSNEGGIGSPKRAILGVFAFQGRCPSTGCAPSPSCGVLLISCPCRCNMA